MHTLTNSMVSLTYDTIDYDKNIRRPSSRTGKRAENKQINTIDYEHIGNVGTLSAARSC